MQKKFKLQTLLEIAIFAGLAMLLDLIPSFKPHPSISISIAMIPIFIIAFRWGFRASLISGFLWGVLQIVTGDAWILTPLQAFLEYFLGFAFIGFAGIFARQIQTNLEQKNMSKTRIYIVIAIFVGSIARYFWHALAFIIFFDQYGIEVANGPVIFSATMNGITALGAATLCSIVLILIISKAPQIVTSANK